MAYQIDSVYIETKEIEIIETETKDFVSYPLSHLWDVYNILGLLDGMIISDHCPETYLYSLFLFYCFLFSPFPGIGE